MNKVYSAVSIVLACTLMGLAQTDKAKKAPFGEPDRNGSAVVLASGTAIEAQLQKTVDVNNARVGDDVILKVTKSIKGNGEILVPKGTTLVGRVTEVQKRSKTNGTSRLGIVFDRIERNGIASPFSASIVSITSAATRGVVGDSLMTDTSAMSQSSGSVSRGSSGGGLLGGVGNTVGGLVNTTTQAAGSATDTVTQTTGNATGAVGRSLSGLQISASAGGSANSSTTLSSPNKNVRVEKGATFNLRVDGQLARQE